MAFETLLDASRARDYVERGLWLGRTLIDIFDDHVASHPDKLACVSRSGRWTYREVDQQKFAPVRQLHRDDVAVPDAEPGEIRGEHLDLVGHLAIGPPAAA